MYGNIVTGADENMKKTPDSGFGHIPVMLRETVDALAVIPDGIYADGTAGGGSHSFELGSRLSTQGTLISVDRDMDAIRECTEKLKPLTCKKELIHTTFATLPSILEERGIKLNGIMMDLGVSSHQLDEASRGFSYMQDAPLDMRMDASSGMSAADVVNTYSESELARIFFEYGEERYSRRIAAAIVEKRAQAPIKTTLELADIIRSAMPRKALNEKQHPAKRVFMAIRIEVNNELGQIRNVLEDILPHMAPKGRIAVITFHSLEDRIVKMAFARFANPCTCPKEFPVCVCGKKPYGKVIGDKAPSKEEIEINPRSRSARLRIFEVC